MAVEVQRGSWVGSSSGAVAVVFEVMMVEVSVN